MRRLSDGLTLIEVVFTALLCPLVVVLLLFVAGAGWSAIPIMAFAVACASIPVIVISWCVVELQRSVVIATNDDPASPQTIVTVPTNVDAALIVDKLSKGGVHARAVSDDRTLGFLSGSLGRVNIVVARQDAERAQAIL